MGASSTTWRGMTAALVTGASAVNNLSANYSGVAGRTAVMWTEGAGSPYSVKAAVIDMGLDINVGGSWSSSGGSFTPTFGTVIMNGSGTSTM